MLFNVLESQIFFTTYTSKFIEIVKNIQNYDMKVLICGFFLGETNI